MLVCVYCMGVVGCLNSQWSMDVRAGIYVCKLFGVMWWSPAAVQKSWSGGWYDLSSPLDGVAWRSPPISVVIVGYLLMISLCIQVRMSLYIVSFAFVWSCGIYADIAMMGDPSYGVSVAAET